VDKSKGTEEIKRFNRSVKNKIKDKNISTIIDIKHISSQDSKGLQACDLFSYGIFTNYSKKENDWQEVFKEKIVYDEIW